MDEERIDENLETEEGYMPRTARQIWAARIGLVLFLLFVVYQLLTIATGGFSCGF